MKKTLFAILLAISTLPASSAWAQQYQPGSEAGAPFPLSLLIYNDLPNTYTNGGNTNQTIAGGAHQSGDILDVCSDPTCATNYFHVNQVGGLYFGSSLYSNGQIGAINGHTTASGTGASITFYAPAAVVVTSSSNSGVSQTLGTGNGYSGEFWTVGCNASVATAQTGGTASISITYPDPNGNITQTVISSMSLATKPFAQSSQTFIQVNGGSATNMSFTPTYGGTSGGIFDAVCTASQVR